MTILLVLVLVVAVIVISGASWKRKNAARAAAEREKPGA